MTNLDRVLKSRDITLPTNVRIVKAMVFLVVIYRYESWTVKKSEYQRTETFKLWCWRRPLRIPWTARRSNQSILKEINPEYSLEGLSLRLKLQYFDHLMQRTNLLEKTLMLGKIEGKRRRGQQRMRRLDSIPDWMDMNLSKLQEIVEDRGVKHAAVYRVTKNQRGLSNWEQWQKQQIEYFLRIIYCFKFFTYINSLFLTYKIGTITTPAWQMRKMKKRGRHSWGQAQLQWQGVCWQIL